MVGCPRAAEAACDVILLQVDLAPRVRPASLTILTDLPILLGGAELPLP